MFIVNHRKIFYTLSGLLVALSIGAVLAYGLNFGIDFKGGSIVEVSYTGTRPSIEEVRAGFGEDRAFAGYSVRPAGENSYILRAPYLSNELHEKALIALSVDNKYPMTENRFNSIGPSIGAEIKNKSLISIGLVLLAIILFITFAFRKVSEPVSSWKYGLIAVVGLVHNIIIPTGLFALLGHYYSVEIDALFVTALLVILGFSIHDTIVVFDRTRENLRLNREYGTKEDFSATVGKSISQTFNRSVNTSLTTVLAILALYFLGSESTKNFSLALLVGIVAGTYSSIFLGSPLLVTWERWQNRGQVVTQKTKNR